MKRFLAFALVAAILGGCGENLDGGKACPSLCPEQSLPLQDVVLDAVAFDTTVGPFPVVGTEPGLLLAERSDTIDVRAVVRYDTIPSLYLRLNVPLSVAGVDSAALVVHIDTTALNFTGSVTLEAYDVDTTAADTNTAAVAALFRPDRLISTSVVSRNTLLLQDTVMMPLSNAFLLAKILGHQRLRVGFHLVGAGDLTLQSVETGLPVLLRYNPAPGDSIVPTGAIAPLSLTPGDDLLRANDFQDYSVVVKAPPPPAVRLLAGGLPASRAYFRFVIPKFYFDSVSIVRAQLELVQRPLHGLGESDLATVYPVVVSATATVSDLTRSAQLVYPLLSYNVQPLIFAPRDSGDRRIDIVQVVRQWALQSVVTVPPQPMPALALVLRGANEGRASGGLAFFGLDAPLDVRPKLRLSFVARTRFGVP